MGEKDFLGIGMKFPPQVNPATGRIVTVSEEARIRQSMFLILSTQLSERPLRPEFGSNMMALAFMNINVSNVNMVVRSITDQISRQEPRVEDIRVGVREGGTSGTILFDISYTITATQVRDSLVYPYYLNQTPEEEEEEAEVYEPETIEEIEP
ncbi:MAG: GPW/gp25 family protein [Lachnospiraceae bacterium]|nr:GPW/gp25 family protein [Lachnospiraceae bacterium]